MIYKAIIDSLLDGGYRAKIRIPYLDKPHTVAASKSNFNLYIANICTMPGCYPTYMPGDVVYVNFEQDDMSKPFIIGALYRKEMTSKINIEVDDIKIDKADIKDLVGVEVRGNAASYPQANSVTY